MPIAPAPAVQRSGARYYRPRWALELAVPIEAAQPASTATPSGELVKFTVPVSRFSLIRNDHNEADTLECTTSWHFAGTDPRLIQSAIGTFHLDQASTIGNTWAPSLANVQFVGVMQRPKRVGSADRGLDVEFLFHDYTAFFLACKHYDTKKLVPEFTDTVSQAWDRICRNTGYPAPDDPTTILPTTLALAGRIQFVGGAQDVVIGTAVPSRFRNLGKVQVHPNADAWAVWQACVGMLGYISFIRGDTCIVTTATDYYTAPNPPRFIWGQNIKELNEERDASVMGKGIVISSFNSLTGTTREGFYPPVGDASVRRKKVAAKKLGSTNAVLSAEDRVGYDFPGIGTQEAVDAFAQRVYEEYSRQEYQGRLETHDMTTTARDGSEFDLLTLYDGDSIQVEIQKEDLDALGQFHGDDSKIGYLVSRRGYTQDVAKLVVANLTGVLSLPPVFLTKRVQIDGETSAEGGSLKWDISFCNKIQVDGGATNASAPSSGSTSGLPSLPP